MPIRHGSPVGEKPRTRTSPPALTQWFAAPAASSRSEATCAAQPFTNPDGSSRPVAYASKKPSVTPHRSAHASSTKRRSADASESSTSPRSKRHTSLSGLYVLKRPSTSRIQAKTSSASSRRRAGGRSSARSRVIVVPMICSTRHSPGRVSAGGTSERLLDRGPQRLLVRVAGLGGAGDGVEVGALLLHHLTAGAVVHAPDVAAVDVGLSTAGQLQRHRVDDLVAGDHDLDLHVPVLVLLFRSGHPAGGRLGRLGGGARRGRGLRGGLGARRPR